eukprot:UN09473
MNELQSAKIHLENHYRSYIMQESTANLKDCRRNR